MNACNKRDWVALPAPNQNQDDTGRTLCLTDHSATEPGTPVPPDTALTHVDTARKARAVNALRELAEPLAALSLAHLAPETWVRLLTNDLSVNAYPAVQGGFVYVGAPRYDTPLEPDLAQVFEVAELAGVVWLKFDAGAAIIDGLPLYPARGDRS